MVLGGQAGIRQIAGFRLPFANAAVIKHFQIVGDDKRNDIVFQTFLEQNQPADAAVSILKRMDGFKLNMEIQKIAKRFPGLCVIGVQQRPHAVFNVFGRGRLLPADLVWQLFVFADGEPVLSAVACAAFQNFVETLYHGLGKRAVGVVDDHINAAEMVGRFNHVIDIDSLFFNADGIGLKNKAGLLAGKAASLDVVGIPLSMRSIFVICTLYAAIGKISTGF